MSQFVSLYDAKTHLSALVDRAAAGEEIVIAKNGVPCARLVPVQQRGEPRKPANGMRITYIAPDFDDPDPRIEAMFGGDPM
jgi:prevent-host-death family protein